MSEVNKSPQLTETQKRLIDDILSIGALPVETKPGELETRLVHEIALNLLGREALVNEGLTHSQIVESFTFSEIAEAGAVLVRGAVLLRGVDNRFSY